MRTPTSRTPKPLQPLAILHRRLTASYKVRRCLPCVLRSKAFPFTDDPPWKGAFARIPALVYDVVSDAKVRGPQSIVAFELKFTSNTNSVTYRLIPTKRKRPSAFMLATFGRRELLGSSLRYKFSSYRVREGCDGNSCHRQQMQSPLNFIWTITWHWETRSLSFLALEPFSCIISVGWSCSSNASSFPRSRRWGV